MVPVDGGTGGILYNPSRTKPVTTWKQLFERPDLKGKVALEDSAESTLAVAGFALGYKDPYKMTDAQLDKVRDYLQAHRSQIRTFYAGDADFLNLYKSHEIDAGFAYHDYRVTAARAGTPGKYSTAERRARLVLRLGDRQGREGPRRGLRRAQLLRLSRAPEVLRHELHVHGLQPEDDRRAASRRSCARSASTIRSG